MLAVKNWLIRTKNKQILGPATKEKVIELIEKGSLTPDDEIACGNGYWFWVRERDLLEKYLYGDLPQTFNPISEAQDVLTAKTTPDGITASVMDSPQKAKQKASEPESNQLPGDDDLAYPDDDDLAYPDMGETNPPSAEALQDLPGHEDDQEGDFSEVHNETSEIEVEQPIVAAAPASAPPTTSDEEGQNFLYPSAEDLEYPDIGEPETPAELDDDRTDPNIEVPGIDGEDVELYEEEQLEVEEDEGELEDEDEYEEEDDHTESAPVEMKAPSRGESSKKGMKKRRVVAERTSNDRYLIYIAIFIVLAIAFVIYYYKDVLNKPLPVIGMQEAHAQTIQSLSKKKISFL